MTNFYAAYDGYSGNADDDDNNDDCDDGAADNDDNNDQEQKKNVCDILMAANTTAFTVFTITQQIKISVFIAWQKLLLLRS